MNRRPSPIDPPSASQPGRQTRIYPTASGSAPHPAPGNQEHQARRFGLARSLIHRHTGLGSRRGIVAMLLVLAIRTLLLEQME